MNENYSFIDLKHEIRLSVKEHNKYETWDGVAYNSATIIAIILTSLSAFNFGNSLSPYSSQILAGIAAMIIAIDRALNWGARWIYHKQMKNEYLIILTKISLYEKQLANFNESESKANFNEIYTEYFNIRFKEVAIPGVKSR